MVLEFSIFMLLGKLLKKKKKALHCENLKCSVRWGLFWFYFFKALITSGSIKLTINSFNEKTLIYITIKSSLHSKRKKKKSKCYIEIILSSLILNTSFPYTYVESPTTIRIWTPEWHIKHLYIQRWNTNFSKTLTFRNNFTLIENLQKVSIVQKCKIINSTKNSPIPFPQI